MFANMRSFAQKVAERFMLEDIVIRHRTPFGLDPDNPKGDDTVTYEPETTTVKGWVVSGLTKTVTADGGLAGVAETDTVRFPVGTRVDTGDELTIKGETWYVADTSADETWPAMLKVTIQRQG